MEQQFRTAIQLSEKLTAAEHAIDYNSKTLLMGSCFAENMGHKLNYFKFDVFTNPYGVLFHPAAIDRIITDCLFQKEYSEEDLVFHNEKWHSFNHHSDFSNRNIEALLATLNLKVQETRKRIQESSHLIITLGTAWVYEEKKTNTIVANCHKIPQSNFNKRLLDFNEICEYLSNTISKIKKLNPKAEIIFTLSPIRHLKDGIQENSLSKALLLAAIHKTLSLGAHYFPAYEIVIDDLRDYRFYKEDMLHPSQVAVDYIWKLFNTSWICNKTKALQKEIQTIQTGLAHKPFDPASEAHQKFLKRLELKIKAVKKEHGIYF